MLRREELHHKLVILMRDKFNLPQETLEESMRLNEDLRIDSVMIIQLIVYIELELGLEVPDETLDPRIFATIGSVLDFMMELTPVTLPEELEGVR
ncbi:phosphopantetheine-binding protein [Paenibacillus aquistagni]|uniref:phosphopantetheine-binding protein n=1 Tax=Paenibacillus aquistagni TaxID=1852522 RepID=UPI000B508CFE|nr:phosphopantetheine-binding protein [Paenibacillus aquistagni]